MLGSVCAVDLNNVSDIENSNLIQDDNQLSYQNLEVSSNGSISDNYSYNFNGEYSGSGVIKSNYENNNVIGSQQISNNDVISEPQSSVSNTVLSGNDTTLYFKNGTTYDVKLTDITGKALSNQTVSFLINGKLYNRTTGSDGVASMNINLVVGKYKITASYAGSSLYAPTFLKYISSAMCFSSVIGVSGASFSFTSLNILEFLMEFVILAKSFL